jgi:hypothetical protein
MLVHPTARILEAIKGQQTLDAATDVPFASYLALHNVGHASSSHSCAKPSGCYPLVLAVVDDG